MGIGAPAGTGHPRLSWGGGACADPTPGSACNGGTLRAMANGDRSRRKEDDGHPGLFDHLAAADRDGVDPPSVDGVPEHQVQERAEPEAALEAWGDEDPSLTAPRASEPADVWERVEPSAAQPLDEAEPAPTVEVDDAVEAPACHDAADGPEVDAGAGGAVETEPTTEPATEPATEPTAEQATEPVDEVEFVREPEQATPTVVEFVRVAEVVPEPEPAPVVAFVRVPEPESAVVPEPAPEPVLVTTPAETVIEVPRSWPGASLAEPAAQLAPLPTSGIWAWLELLRLSNVLTVATNALVGLWIAHLIAGAATIESFLAWLPKHIGVIAGVCLLYLFGMVVNDLVDQDTDAVERPARPLPSGRIGRRAAILLAATLLCTGMWIAGGGSFPVPGLAAIAVGLAFGSFSRGTKTTLQWIGEGWAVVGVAAILWNWLDHWRAEELRAPWGFESLLLLAGSIVAYSLVHQRSKAAVVLLGLCRALAYWCPVLLTTDIVAMRYNGSSASAWGLLLFPGLLAFALTVAVSLRARHEATPAHDDPDLQAALASRWWVAGLLILCVLVPWAFSPVVTGDGRGVLQVMTIVALPMALFCGGIFLVKALHAERAMRCHPTRIASGVAAWIAAYCLLDAFTLSVLGAPGLAVAALGCWWVTRAAQRRVAGS